MSAQIDLRDHTCPNCGGPVPPGRTFCRLSCRLAHERQQVRTPNLFPSEMTLETELSSDDEMDRARDRRRVWKLPSD